MCYNRGTPIRHPISTPRLDSPSTQSQRCFQSNTAYLDTEAISLKGETRAIIIQMYSLSWQDASTLVIALLGGLVFHRLFLHPLSRYPGPKLAAITRWYEGYYDVIKNGQYTFKIKELHRKYGETFCFCVMRFEFPT